MALFEAAKAGGGAAVESKSLAVALPSHTRYIGAKTGSTDRPDLQTAKRVVSGGRALGSAGRTSSCSSAWRIKSVLRSVRHAPPSMRGTRRMKCKSDQTGKTISPDIYIAIGISGAIQHLTGIKDARTIVAINKDGEAPIFEVADIRFGRRPVPQIVPELERLVSGCRGRVLLMSKAASSAATQDRLR